MVSVIMVKFQKDRLVVTFTFQTDGKQASLATHPSLSGGVASETYWKLRRVASIQRFTAVEPPHKQTIDQSFLSSSGR